MSQPDIDVYRITCSNQECAYVFGEAWLPPGAEPCGPSLLCPKCRAESWYVIQPRTPEPQHAPTEGPFRMTPTPPPTDRLRELFAGLDPKKYTMKPGTDEPWAYNMAPAKLWEEAKAEAESLRAQADRAERLAAMLREARDVLREAGFGNTAYDCDAALADAEGGT